MTGPYSGSHFGRGRSSHLESSGEQSRRNKAKRSLFKLSSGGDGKKKKKTGQRGFFKERRRTIAECHEIRKSLCSFVYVKVEIIRALISLPTQSTLSESTAPVRTLHWHSVLYSFSGAAHTVTTQVLSPWVYYKMQWPKTTEHSKLQHKSCYYKYTADKVISQIPKGYCAAFRWLCDSQSHDICLVSNFLFLSQMFEGHFDHVRFWFFGKLS